MKNLLAAAAIFVFAQAIPASAAEYLHVNGHNGNWRQEVMAFLAKNRPKPDDISSGFSGTWDLHIFVKPGNFSGTYELQWMKHPEATTTGIIKALVDGHSGKILGYSDNDVHVLTWHD